MKHGFPIPQAALITALMTLLHGCASVDNFGCDVHEQNARTTKSITTYRPAPARPNAAPAYSLPAGSVPQVTTYKLTFRPGFTKPCTTVTLRKEVVIQRSDEAQVVLNEIREFYAEDGTLIASATQDVTEQVVRSGAYTATTPLPIPKIAPPGKYKIVSKLMFERRGERKPASLVARAEGFFYIIPPK